MSRGFAERGFELKAPHLRRSSYYSIAPHRWLSQDQGFIGCAIENAESRRSASLFRMAAPKLTLSPFDKTRAFWDSLTGLAGIGGHIISSFDQKNSNRFDMAQYGFSTQQNLTK